MIRRPDAPDLNSLDRETALRMWTENVTWFSDEEGKKARIQVRLFFHDAEPRLFRLCQR
jgi:hypothetical protein